jgi:NADPH:quinone reductase-like Zn-dependent oxidoreductase
MRAWGVVSQAGVDNVGVGDRVLVPRGTHAWAQVVHAPARDLFLVDPAIDPKQASMLTINPPTASCCWTIMDLKPGDWVAINGGNSGVGRALLAFAKGRGLRTISIVRGSGLVDELKGFGGDVVVVNSDTAVAQVRDLTTRMPVRLGLDGLSGDGTAHLAEMVTQRGELVTYGAMMALHVTVNAGALIGKGLSVHGFYMYAPDNLAKLANAMAAGARLIKEGKLHVPVAATYALEDIKTAVGHALKGGKVLLDLKARSKHYGRLRLPSQLCPVRGFPARKG